MQPDDGPARGGEQAEHPEASGRRRGVSEIEVHAIGRNGGPAVVIEHKSPPAVDPHDADPKHALETAAANGDAPPPADAPEELIQAILRARPRHS